VPGRSMARQYVRAAVPRLGPAPRTAPELRLRCEGVETSARDVRAYAEVVGQPPSERLPPLYPHLFGFGLQLKIMNDPAFPFPALGLVHVSNEVTTTRPLLLGEKFDVEVQAGEIGAHPRGRVVDLHTTVSRHGEPVWAETSTYLRRERPAGAAAGEGRTSQEHRTSEEHRPQAVEIQDAAALHFSARWRLPANLGRSYARVSGDINPIHLSSWTARPLGFPRAIAHGMWTAAAVLGALDGRLPDALRYQVEFRRPISLPSTVRLFTAISGTTIDAAVRSQDQAGRDRLHLIGRAEPS
jgi:acyl dehydratase